MLWYKQENCPEDRKDIIHGQLLVGEYKKKRDRKQMIKKHFFRVTCTIQFNSSQLIWTYFSYIKFIKLTKIQNQKKKKNAKLHQIRENCLVAKLAKAFELATTIVELSTIRKDEGWTEWSLYSYKYSTVSNTGHIVWQQS